MCTSTFLQVTTDNNNLKLHSVVSLNDKYVSTINPMTYKNNMDRFLDNFYFKRYNNMESKPIVIYALYAAYPNLFRAKRYNKELGKFENGVGGIDVSIATLVKRYLNSTIVFPTMDYDIRTIAGQHNPNLSVTVDLIAPTEKVAFMKRFNFLIIIVYLMFSYHTFYLSFKHVFY